LLDTTRRNRNFIESPTIESNQEGSLHLKNSRGFALSALAGAVGVLCVGCGRVGEPTTIDLSGQLEIKQLGGAAPGDREALQAALVRSIQKRTPSDVRVVFNGGSGTGKGGSTQRAEGAGGGPASVDTCGFLPESL